MCPSYLLGLEIRKKPEGGQYDQRTEKMHNSHYQANSNESGGSAGCTALILAGFGLQDSIFSIIPKQFEEISVYDGMMAFKNEDTLEAKAPLESELRADPQVEDAMLAKQLKMSVALDTGGHSKDAYLYVPETPAEYSLRLEI